MVCVSVCGVWCVYGVCVCVCGVVCVFVCVCMWCVVCVSVLVCVLCAVFVCVCICIVCDMWCVCVCCVVCVFVCVMCGVLRGVYVLHVTVYVLMCVRAEVKDGMACSSSSSLAHPILSLTDPRWQPATQSSPLSLPALARGFQACAGTLPCLLHDCRGSYPKSSSL